MLKIQSNGSRWAGGEPDTIETLLELLSREPLRPDFEKFGNFITHPVCRGVKNPAWTWGSDAPEWINGPLIYPENPGAVRFWGNFLNVSHVFSIDTDEPEIIDRLTAAIRANQASAAYKDGRKAFTP